MAYNLSDRFLLPPKCIRLFDPGAYDKYGNDIKTNKVPFLSRTPRITQFGTKIWTQSIYYADKRPKIPNCTSMMSKIPRFPYEAFSKKDLEDLICRCDLQTCECSVEEVEQEDEIVCQAGVRKRLYKGSPPRSKIGVGLSAPSKRDRGFEIFSDGSQKRLLDYPKSDCPPFYEARVNEATAFYRGCKWSKQKSQRNLKSLEVRPGPADYQFERQPTEHDLCIQQLRSYRKKISKQLRFLDMIQRMDILEGRPGPPRYNPIELKGTKMQSYGSKAERFPIPKYNICPGPTAYSPKRDFDPPKPPEYPCHAKLPEPACFDVKAERFKNRPQEGPGPASYCATYTPCQFMHYGAGVAPFGSSSVRFKQQPLEDDDSDEFTNDVVEGNEQRFCPPLTWEFKSQTTRMKPLKKKFDEPGPADMAMTRTKVDRDPLLQYLAPFNSSLGRFQPWHDWMPVHESENTPGPCYYSLEKPKCQPAVNRGPLYRASRFVDNRLMTPAPNEYNVGGGVETVLDTHNNRLNSNIQNLHKFCWNCPADKEPVTIQRQETILLDKCIALCDGPEDKNKDIQKKKPVEEVITAKDTVKPKLLRCFLYKKSIPLCN